MNRYIWCFAATLLLGSSLRAGEMDSEFGGKAAPPPAGPQKARVSAATRSTVMLTGAGEARAAAWKASELDQERPSQAWGHHGFGGFGHHGFGGWGGGWGRGFGYGGYGGFGGYGYRGFGLGLGLGGFGLGYGGFGGLGYGGFGGLGYGGFGGYGMGYGGYGMGYGGYGMGYGGYGMGFGSSYLYQSAFYPSFGYGYGRGFGCW